ncbi:MAG: class I poly(R)-hydroxyalkanoic acid synthase [Castellaniella sp.]|uniref:class I poly(R)-hydroxyalkanoic acid synthase n=1 Tax=Castellaniella sp. TaxID=1955812 RepID=UPI002A36B516|nr:class I poly(R)-hydroxyalkanoic acid synthase [Castellaniella sp.]MDY0309145.1 class I poly(R)-hydroxyalkanoic acid synthase [Castellaniella sp.]
MTDRNSSQVQAPSWVSPVQLAAIQSDFIQAWQSLLDRFRQGLLAPPADRRFSSDAWAGDPRALLSAHAYLIVADTLQRLAQAADLEAAARERLKFTVMQWVEAAAPCNFLVSNPDALQAAADSEGDSLQRGLVNLMRDLARGRITQTDESAFTPGENLALTPGAVVYENALMQLIQYQPQTPKVRRRPLLMVPPCINKYYILDLQPANSLVLHAVQAGFEVFMVSWRNPLPGDTDGIQRKTWDDYLEEGVLRAIQVARDVTRQPQINALGFCVGGTLLASALAVARARGEDPVAALTLLTTFLDFRETGILDVFVDEQHARVRERQLGAGGLMTAGELATTFSFLRPAELVWNYVGSNYLMGESPRPFDLLAWNADGTNLPGPFFTWYFRNTYLENRLKTGQLRMCGTAADLQALDMPAYLYASREDHIVPWTSAYASTRLLRGPLRFVLGESGHIAGVVNPPARGRRGYWACGQDAALPSDPHVWLDQAEHAKGSWWPDWLDWLAQHSGDWKAIRRGLGNRKYPVIEPAPGRYVKVKAV